VSLQRLRLTLAVPGLGCARPEEAAAGPQPCGGTMPWPPPCHHARGRPCTTPCSLQDMPNHVLSFASNPTLP